LSYPYQEGNQVYYYNQNTLGFRLSEIHDPSLQSYDNDTYTGSKSCTPHPEMLMVLKKVQPTNALTPVSSSGIFYSVPAQSLQK
jgi:hypothetical protein